MSTRQNPTMYHHLPFLLIFSLLTLPTTHSTTHLRLPSSRKLRLHDTLDCPSWRFSVEVNNAGVWTTVPASCVGFVKDYMTGDPYLSDSSLAAQDALDFAKSVDVSGDGFDAWVFDIDETLLSGLPYYSNHGFGSEKFNQASYNAWTSLADAPALPASLALYKELQSLGFTIFLLTGRDESVRSVTETNLRDAGYSNWKRLILRGPSDQGVAAIEYKSGKRKELVDEGYRIRGNSGDQWSDLLGHAIAERSFKLPNIMYYIA